MEVGKIYGAISRIMDKVGVIGKDKKNTQQGYNFRGIDDMYNALNKHLAEEKVFATSTVLDMKREERTSKSGAILLYTILTIKFTFFTDDGSKVESVTVGEAMDSGDKSCNKAMSTAYKYALMQIFCIPTQEDKDTESQTNVIVKPPTIQPSPIPKQPTPLPTAKEARVIAEKAIKESKTVPELEKVSKKIAESKILTGEDKEELFVKVVDRKESIELSFYEKDPLEN